MTLKEKVFAEEENSQDYQKRREEEKVRNGSSTWSTCFENFRCGWRGVLWMSQEWFVKDGKRRQSNAKAWYGRLSLPDIF